MERHSNCRCFFSRPLPARWSPASPASPSASSYPAIWLYILTPLQTATLIIAFGLTRAGLFSVWKLRGALRLATALAVCGRRRARRSRRRRHPDLGEPRPCAHGRRRAFLVLYSLYALLRPATPEGGARRRRGRRRHRHLNGVLGGITGLAGILVTIWCGLRGWPSDVQRTVFQPVAVAIFADERACGSAPGAQITPDTIKLFLIGLRRPCSPAPGLD